VLIVVYLVILVAAFFFLIVRPQRRQQMIRRQIIAAVQVGDQIITSGGVYGTVVALAADALDLEIAPGVTIKVARGAVAERIFDEDETDDELDDVVDLDETEIHELDAGTDGDDAEQK
jgi:preprotein translocase subunit YajC